MKQFFQYLASAAAIFLLLSFMLISFAKGGFQELSVFSHVIGLVDKYYVEKVDIKKLIYGSINGLLATLDPHTIFLPEDVYKDFSKETSGKFGGLGIELTIRNGVLTIISPIEDSPAWKAGIKPHDKIVSINGVMTKNFSLADAAKALKGRNGTKVTLGVFRKNLKKPINISIVRKVVSIKPVKYVDLHDGFGYFRITNFIENTSLQMRKKLKGMMKKHKNIRGIILDLRKNPGGLLSEAINVTNLFLSDGVIVSTKGRIKERNTISKATSTSTETPKANIIVLVDESSASASEIVAGALQDHKRALIMGRKTFGKGSVQSVIPLENGSGLKLTIARYYTPKGRSIQAKGITPDVHLNIYNHKLLEKAKIDKTSFSENNYQGHLKSEIEKKTRDSLDRWWNSQSKHKKQSAGAKLLNSDFEIMEAFNYLRAWSIIGK